MNISVHRGPDPLPGGNENPYQSLQKQGNAGEGETVYGSMPTEAPPNGSSITGETDVTGDTGAGKKTESGNLHDYLVANQNGDFTSMMDEFAGIPTKDIAKGDIGQLARQFGNNFDAMSKQGFEIQEDRAEGAKSGQWFANFKIKIPVVDKNGKAVLDKNGKQKTKEIVASWRSDMGNMDKEQALEAFVRQAPNEIGYIIAANRGKVQAGREIRLERHGNQLQNHDFQLIHSWRHPLGNTFKNVFDSAISNLKKFEKGDKGEKEHLVLAAKLSRLDPNEKPGRAKRAMRYVRLMQRQPLDKVNAQVKRLALTAEAFQNIGIDPKLMPGIKFGGTDQPAAAKSVDDGSLNITVEKKVAESARVSVVEGLEGEAAKLEASMDQLAATRDAAAPPESGSDTVNVAEGAAVEAEKPPT